MSEEDNKATIVEKANTTLRNCVHGSFFLDAVSLHILNKASALASTFHKMKLTKNNP